MDRKKFLRKGLFGTGMFVASTAIGKVLNNSIDELASLEATPMDTNIGFNHIPNTNSKIMNNTILHKANTRGHASHGWLNTYHTFSFANYYNPERMHFGVLRVLNDDKIDGGMGFGTHPHDNMEIITIPLSGTIEHKDSMGNIGIINRGDIQVMSAGTGIQHSEYNKLKDEALELLQIWVFPNKKNVQPRYDQISLDLSDRHNKLQQILSPNADDAGVWIHQDAWFQLGQFDQDLSFDYSIKKPGNGVYAFVISGDFEVAGEQLNARDGMGVWDIDTLSIKSLSQGAEILLMEVPMAMNA